MSTIEIEQWLVHMLNTYRPIYMGQGGINQYPMRLLLRKVYRPELMHLTVTLSDTMEGVVCVNAFYDLEAGPIMDISEDVDEYIDDNEEIRDVMFLPGKHRATGRPYPQSP